MIIAKNNLLVNNQLMGATSAELELVQYRVGEVGQVTNRLVYNFAKYSGIGGTNKWPLMMHEVSSLIQEQTGFNCLWEANGVDVAFSYFLDPTPKIRDGQLVFSSPEPRVAFIERPELVSPPVRTHVERVIEEIALEMQNVYHLRMERSPLVLIFPKAEYGQSVERFKVPLIAA